MARGWCAISQILPLPKGSSATPCVKERLWGLEDLLSTRSIVRYLALVFFAANRECGYWAKLVLLKSDNEI